MKTACGNPCKNFSTIQQSDQKLWPFWADTQGCRLDVLVTDQRFHSIPNENSLWKPLYKFERDPTIRAKVMALLSRYSMFLTRNPSPWTTIPQLPQRKRPLETAVKFWAGSNGRIKRYGRFEPVLRVGDQTSSSLNSDSITYQRKTASRNPCKI